MAGVFKLLLSCYLALLGVFQTCSAVDFISTNQSIRDGETVVSAQETFEMGFFSPGNSRYRYFGIWYKRQATGTVVWVANREIPVTNTSGVLRLDPGGILEIRDASDRVIWSSKSSGPATDPVAQLLDTGNLVIKDQRDSNPHNFIWQSFDFPGDTIIPGMKFGKDLVRGIDWSGTSWKSPDDPSPGNFTILIDTKGYPQNLVKHGSDIMYRPGPWNGVRFTGQPNLRQNPIYTFGFVLNQEEVYYHFELISSSVLTRVVVIPNGKVQRFLWIDSSQDWTVYLTTMTDNYDSYKWCGANGNCNIDNSPACGCLEGFEPVNPEQWNKGDWSHGCCRRTSLDCGSGEGFQKFTEKKLPDTQTSWYNLSVNLDECQQLCKSNCSCTAYANANISGSGSGCILWFGDLLDTRDFPNNGQDIYVRMAASELPPATSGGKNSKTMKQVKIIIPVVSALISSLGLLLLYVFKRRKLKRQGYTNEAQNDDLELPSLGLSTLLSATNNFSMKNKLGEGGFGAVYKGVLEDGQEIAVKRLSKTSCQGLEEFKNEVICISKLQHRNLVKLLGCCIQGEEKMLVYEYMPNKCLDSYIFGLMISTPYLLILMKATNHQECKLNIEVVADKSHSKLLSWPQRWYIINGIARGLLYLHQDSRLRIIHRDLKASNILLDSDLNPKISDFGIAKRFGGNETQANTNRVIGTYGYMSPEYAGDGIFSVKSDVFSFGVLVLEILSGKRNRGFSHQDHYHNLLGHVWILYQEGRLVELADAPMDNSINLSEFLRSIHVGLLCVQHNPEDRPAMSSVVLMLGSEGALPPPKQPGFFMGTSPRDSGLTTSTANDLTVTMVTGR